MKRFLATVSFSFALGFSGMTSAEETSLTLLTEENPPYSYQDIESGDLKGTGVSLVKELMRRSNTKFTLTLLPWKRAFREAQENENTCVFVVNRTPAREPLFSWVGPLFEGGWAVYKRPDSEITIQTPADMKPYNVVGKSGSASVDEIEKAAGIKIIRTGKDELAAKMLYYGRADLWVSGVVDGPLGAKAAGLPAPALALLWKKANLSLACSRQTNTALIEQLNKINQSLDELRKEVLALHSSALSQAQ
ncbi:MAG: ABC transporter substrate-binding protein [Alphaproteobacteria bacterium]|nr:ABC transporter substrate-binding protein [Alphaproteobacteria bacterium]